MARTRDGKYTADEWSYQICGGPNKYDLMLALFDSTSDFSRPVTFQIDSIHIHRATIEKHKSYLDEQMVASVMSVERNDLTGDDWYIHCWISAHKPGIGNKEVWIVYSTHTRTGALYFDEKDGPRCRLPSNLPPFEDM